MRTIPKGDSVTQAIGPRRVGGRYYCGYWGLAYTVTALWRESEGPGPWEIVVRWDDGRSTRHATAWDARYDRVLTAES